MAGFRSPLFLLGIAATASAPVADVGVRSLLAPWIGGASAPASAPTPAGIRSFLAPWIGGACAGPLVIQAPAQQVAYGGIERTVADDDKEVLELITILAYSIQSWQRN